MIEKEIKLHNISFRPMTNRINRFITLPNGNGWVLFLFDFDRLLTVSNQGETTLSQFDYVSTSNKTKHIVGIIDENENETRLFVDKYGKLTNKEEEGLNCEKYGNDYILRLFPSYKENANWVDNRLFSYLAETEFGLIIANGKLKKARVCPLKEPYTFVTMSSDKNTILLAKQIEKTVKLFIIDNPFAELT